MLLCPRRCQSWCYRQEHWHRCLRSGLPSHPLCCNRLSSTPTLRQPLLLIYCCCDAPTGCSASSTSWLVNLYVYWGSLPPFALIWLGVATTSIDAFGWPVKPILALLVAKSITAAASPATEGVYGDVGWLWEVLWRNMVERVERAKWPFFVRFTHKIGKVGADALTSAVHNSSGVKLRKKMQICKL